MEHLTKDLFFPLVAAGNNILDIIPKYNNVVDKLLTLENKFKQLDAAFDMDNMWTCSCTNGKLLFELTMHCHDLVLKNEMTEIFWNVLS
jgi:hypothetical protein